MILMALVGGVKGAAIERDGEILFVDDRRLNDNHYYLDVNGDGLPDQKMNISPYNAGTNLFIILSRYLEQSGAIIIFEDEGLGPNQNFTASRMIGFIMPNGNYVRLDQLTSPAEIQRFFPYLWQKIQAEQRAGR